MALGKIHYLPDLGLGNLKGKDADHRDAFLVNRQHQFKGLTMGQPEKTLQHMDDKLHGRVVIIKDQNLIKRWALGLGPGLGCDTGIAIDLIILVGHGDLDRLQRVCSTVFTAVT